MQNTIDPEVLSFLIDQPALTTYAQLEARCVRRFGRERTPSLDTIRAYFLARNSGRRREPWHRDEEVRAFVSGLVGRISDNELYRRCRERFGDRRSPSRRSISLYTKELRERLGVRPAASRAA